MYKKNYLEDATNVVASLNIFKTNNPEFTMIELAEKVIELTGSKSKMVFMPLPQDDPMQRKPDITVAQRELNNWEPKIKLEEGLIKTIDYFRTVV